MVFSAAPCTGSLNGIVRKIAGRMYTKTGCGLTKVSRDLAWYGRYKSEYDSIAHVTTMYFTTSKMSRGNMRPNIEGEQPQAA